MKNIKKYRKTIIIFAIVVIAVIVILHIPVKVLDVPEETAYIEQRYFQYYGIKDYAKSHSTHKKEVPEGREWSYVPLKDYYRAKSAIDKGAALSAIIEDELQNFAESNFAEYMPVKKSK